MLTDWTALGHRETLDRFREAVAVAEGCVRAQRPLAVKHAEALLELARRRAEALDSMAADVADARDARARMAAKAAEAVDALKAFEARIAGKPSEDNG